MLPRSRGCRRQSWRLTPLIESSCLDRFTPLAAFCRTGFPGCKPYAQAIAKGEAEINQCPPGGDEGIHKLADLLGRDPVPPFQELLTRNIEGKSILVTGAGGSVGSELVRQILRWRQEKGRAWVHAFINGTKDERGRPVKGVRQTRGEAAADRILADCAQQWGLGNDGADGKWLEPVEAAAS